MSTSPTTCLAESALFAGSFSSSARSRGAFTLPEVLMATMIAAVSIGLLVQGYISALKRAEWSAYSLAAHSVAMQSVEQTRAAKWDLQAWPPIDELRATNWVVTTNVLDIPTCGTNWVYATNFVAVSDVTANPPLKLVRVECVWMFNSLGPFTNTVAVYRAPDQ
jgi:type II secretory pathway pseudopilin PulG